jgi:hypothetical protein
MSAAWVGCGGGGATTPEESPDRPAAVAPKAESGEASFFLALDNDTGGEESNTRVTLSFWRQRRDEPPSFDATVESIGYLNGSSAGSAGHLIYTPQRAVLEYEGQSYELDPAVLSSDNAAIAACERALQGIDLGGLLQRERDRASAAAAVGEPTGNAVGALNVPAGQRTLRGLVQRSACGVQLKAVPFARVLAEGIAAAVGRYGIKSRVAVGTEGGDFRRLLVRAFLNPKKPTEDEYDGLLELTLARVEEVDRNIPPAAQAQPIAVLAKKVGSSTAKELEAGAEALTGLIWGAIGR